jgi:hypothetical protein
VILTYILFHNLATKTLREVADAVTRAHCCEDCCILNKIGYDQGKKLVLDCMTKRDSMNRVENKNDLRRIVKVISDMLCKTNVVLFNIVPIFSLICRIALCQEMIPLAIRRCAGALAMSWTILA